MNILDQFKLDGKVAIVTGAGQGIGKRVALGYLQAGAKVVLAALDDENLMATASEFEESFPGCSVSAPCDVTVQESVDALVATTMKKWGRLDIAVCNAGIVTLNSLEEMSLEEFERIQKVNVSGVFLTAQACAKSMIEKGEGGSIIVTASMSATVINTPQKIGHYCASKAAAKQLAKAMAVEFAEHNVRVNSVSPGYIMTELVEPLIDFHALWKPQIPMRRLGTPEELMGLYLYLASDASTYMTGSDVIIDGGFTSV
ncbi:MAG: SDR family oxidoreductase [Kiritimatiellae bacterium]|jgi:sorbose reductase|nr:SDR family oxidoreductase [Kiritimatiellia bacterium]